MTLKLYLGAHKTATTHIQGILMVNRDILLNNNIKLSSPQDIRNEWLQYFFKYCKNPKIDLLQKVQFIRPPQGTWVLTDENIIGVSNDLTVSSGIYPNAGKRLYCMQEAFRDVDIELFFSIRSYETFYRSAYSEIVRNRGYISFEEFYDEDRFRNNSWIETIKMFVEVVPEDKITLWCFEDFKSLMPTIISKVTGLSNSEELIQAYTSSVTRPSLSQKTIDILDMLDDVISREESQSLVERINKKYSIGNGYENLVTFNKEEIHLFQKKYQEDIQAIKEKFPNINFL
ncbi:MAG: hypothetical protein DRG78_18315 [Epsilonproteobacteria bacterium]|nr:MAG: hypothetical protein DRG78_18315 [Campylobacterota bacterium]